VAPADILQGPFARTLINSFARRLARTHRFTDMDDDDLRQELRVRLWQALARFDPGHGHENKYVTAVLARAAAGLIRERNAKKRDPTRVRSFSWTWDRRLDGGAHADRRADEARADLAIDLTEFLTLLPADLRALAERLMVQTLAAAARDLEVPRSSLRRRVERLRRRFEDEGLDIYL